LSKINEARERGKYVHFKTTRLITERTAKNRLYNEKWRLCALFKKDYTDFFELCKVLDEFHDDSNNDCDCNECMSQVSEKPVMEIEKEETKFTFIPKLSRYYDNTVKNVVAVNFDISYSKDHSHCLTFCPPVTEKVAVKTVEAFLSRPMTKEFFDLVEDGLFNKPTWEKAQQYLSCYGDCLGFRRFINEINSCPHNEYIVLNLVC